MSTPEFTDPIDLPDVKAWTERAVEATLSLWDAKNQCFFRSSDEAIGAEAEKPALRPTVTYLAIGALADAGVLLEGAKLKSGDKVLVCEGAQLEVSGVQVQLQATGLYEARFKDGWIEEAVAASEHGGKASATPRGPSALALAGKAPRDEAPEAASAPTSGSPHSPMQATSVAAEESHPRETLVLAPMSYALWKLCKNLPDSYWNDAGRRTKLRNSVTGLTDRLMSIFPAPRLFAAYAGANGNSHGDKLSPQMAVYAATIVASCLELQTMCESSQEATDSEFERTKGNLNQLGEDLECYCRREVERQLARSHAPLEASFDAASLAYALNGLAVLNASSRMEPLFGLGVEAVAAAQLSDGSWAAGATVYFGKSPIMQPSVEIALQLASAVFDRSSLFRCEGHHLKLMRAALPALHRHLVAVAANYRRVPPFSGWENDRARSSDIVRAYDTALATRLITTVRLIRVALERELLLSKYKPEWPSKKNEEPWRKTRSPVEIWKESVKEPDQAIRPCERLSESILAPIATQMGRKQDFIRPDKNGVSFILYGPPGSGKTYLLQSFARSLGWPLVSLSPGNFIKDGLERIEATASEIFDDLRRIDHAIVLFDECDELFRDRGVSENGASQRNILSFATASMLPKLQQLHDARKVIFVLATNYVSNLDKAIRREGRFDLNLLFDRPDDACRTQLFQEGSDLKAGEVTKLTMKSAGWMTKQILDLKSEYLKLDADQRGAYLDSRKVGIADYEEWCTEEAVKELKAAQPKAEELTAKEAQWAPFMKKK